jgi:outer membrane lipoprotein carrier protein
MKKSVVKKIYCLSSLFCCLAFASYSQDTSFVSMTDSAGFKKKLEASSKTTKTIVCDFTQEKKQSMLANTVISQGHFWFKKPVSIRWEYDTPYSYLIIFTKSKVIVKDDGGKKQYETQSGDMFKELGVMMFNFLQGKISAFSKDYTITYKENNQDYYLKMIPKSAKMKAMLTQIDLYFDKTDLSVSKIKMLETEGDYTLIEFLNKKLNVDVADSVFTSN